MGGANGKYTIGERAIVREIHRKRDRLLYHHKRYLQIEKEMFDLSIKVPKYDLKPAKLRMYRSCKRCGNMFEKTSEQGKICLSCEKTKEGQHRCTKNQEQAD